jgi:hypothetical protein
LTGAFKTVDHFLMHIKLGGKVCDARRIVGGPNSDHDPVVLKLRFGHHKNTMPPKRSKPRIAWHKLDDPGIAAEFKEAKIKTNNKLLEKGAPSSKAFSNAIMDIAKETCPKDKATMKG